MTYAQFRRMKPKYKMRLILVCVIAFALFVGIVFGIAGLFRLVGQQFNTQKIENVTAKNVLQKETLTSILTLMKQNDSSKVVVLDSTLTYSDKGIFSFVEMHLADVSDTAVTNYWTLTANEKKAYLRKTKPEKANRSGLLQRKLTMRDYFPALSRVNSIGLIQYFEDSAPVGSGGRYTFVDSFDDNLKPDPTPYLTKGLPGIWVNNIGTVTVVDEGYKPPKNCVPLVCSMEAADPEKSKPKKPVLLEPTEAALIMLECAPY